MREGEGLRGGGGGHIKEESTVSLSTSPKACVPLSIPGIQESRGDDELSDIVGQVLSVSGRATNRGGTIFDIAFSDGQKYTTFQNEIAQKANGLVGQPVSARVTVKPSKDGRFTNYYLEDIAPQGQLPAQAMPAPGGTVIPISAGATEQAQIPMQAPDTTKDERITRLSALKTAFEFVGALFNGAGPETLQEAREHALELARDLYQIGYYGQSPAEMPDTPEEVAAVVNAEVPGAVTVGARELPKW